MSLENEAFCFCRQAITDTLAKRYDEYGCIQSTLIFKPRGYRSCLRDYVAKHLPGAPDLPYIPMSDGYCSYTNIQNTYVVLAIEIEDSNKLSREKLHDYTDVWWWFDCETTDIAIGLITTDRYGANPNIHSLLDWWYVFLETQKNGA